MSDVQSAGHSGQSNLLPPLKSKRNTFALAGFILSVLGLLLCWLPFVGGPFWLAGLVLSGQGMNRQPRGLAIAGLTISVLVFLLIISL